MHPRVIVVSVTIALLSAALAGCVGGFGPQANNSTAPPPANETTGDAGGADDAAGNGTDDGSEGNATDEDSDGSSDDDGAGNGTGSGNETGGNATDDGSDGNGSSDAGWPAPADARIRPGVKIADGTCTANFVFSSPDNATLYIGTASHCVGGMSTGDRVTIAGEGAGTLVYCSWQIEMEADACPEDSTTESDPDNDFALVEIHDSRRGTVHPAVLGFGGPTDLAVSGQVSTGDRVLTYGNTPLRDPASAHDPREGVVTTSGDWTTTAYFATPSVFGDSGSPVLTADGQALGVLVTIVIAPQPAANGIVNLDAAVAYMEDNTDLDVELKTWDLIDAGLSP